MRRVWVMFASLALVACGEDDADSGAAEGSSSGGAPASSDADTSASDGTSTGGDTSTSDMTTVADEDTTDDGASTGFEPASDSGESSLSGGSGGDEPTGCVVTEDDSDPFADCVESFEPAAQTDFNHDLLPDIVLGAPQAGMDVASLGCGGTIVLFFDGRGIVDGPGEDLIVFENPFAVTFPEPGEVSVSADGQTWSTFPCDPTTLEGCAGVSITLATPDSGIDPTDPEQAGGDAFDLEDLGLEQVHWVRIEDVSADYWSTMDMDWCDPGQGGSGGFDLDAVAVVH